MKFISKKTSTLFTSICLLFCINLTTLKPAQAKTKSQNYDTCFTTSSGKIRQIRSIKVKGSKLIVVGPLKRGKKILSFQKRTFKISQKAKYYMAQDISMSSVSKSTFSKYCRNISSYSSADTLKTFSFKKRGKQITKLIYYP